MHELSLAAAIVEIAERHAAGRPVSRVDVRVGRLRQVVPDALTFGFEVLVQDTPLQGARLELQMVPAVGRCRACGVETTFEQFPLLCGGCGSMDLEIVSGDELIVTSLEVEEVPSGGEDRAAVD
jgi:hydrogenase nickel incorporation protein HypA/HybF